MRKQELVFAAAVALVVAAVAAPAAQAAAEAEARQPVASSTIGLLDTGINPYHQVFRDTSPAAQRHPSTRFAGFPRNAEALRLTLDADSYQDALAADCERVWSRLETGRLYWFPGTTVIGAISFREPVGVDCNRPKSLLLLDNDGHGTMTASRAVSRTRGACPGCPLVMAQLGGGNRNVDAVRWLGGQAPWLDVESHSWGPLVPLWAPSTEPVLHDEHAGAVSTPAFVRAVETSAQQHLAFWSSGNGVASHGGVLGHPSQADARLTPSVLSVGGHDSGRVVAWSGSPPHLAADVCVESAVHNSLDEQGPVGGPGTSAATPYVAGNAARLLREARGLLRDPSTGVRGTGQEAVVARGRPGIVRRGPLSDGRLTMGEWRRVLLATATTRPAASADDARVCDHNWGPYGATPLLWKDLPEQFPEHVNIGYGAVDPPAWTRGVAVLRGKVDLPVRTRTDEFFARDDQLRRAAYQVFSR